MKIFIPTVNSFASFKYIVGVPLANVMHENCIAPWKKTICADY